MTHRPNEAACARLSPEEALEAVDQGLDPTSFESLLEHVWILRALANDQSFLSRQVNEDLRRALEGGKTQLYSPQSMIVARNEKCAFRANLWYPAASDSERQRAEKKLYSYELPHDHNFSFATIGYFGPGYRTDLYRYDRSRVQGLPGEKVDLSFKETAQLSVGRVLVFESGRDVHTQYTPESLSISLNLICSDAVEAAKPQYLFDVASSSIVGLAEHKLTRSVALVRFAKHLGNAESIELVEAIAQRAAQPILRAAGFDALLQLAPAADRDRIERQIGDDPDALMPQRVAQIGDFAL